MKVLGDRERSNRIERNPDNLRSPPRTTHRCTYRPYVHRNSLADYVQPKDRVTFGNDSHSGVGSYTIDDDSTNGDVLNEEAEDIDCDNVLNKPTGGQESSFSTPPRASAELHSSDRRSELSLHPSLEHHAESAVILEHLHHQEDVLKEQTLAVQQMLVKLDSAMKPTRHRNHPDRPNRSDLAPTRQRDSSTMNDNQPGNIVPSVSAGRAINGTNYDETKSGVDAYSYYVQQSQMVNRLLHAPTHLTTRTTGSQRGRWTDATTAKNTSAVSEGTGPAANNIGSGVYHRFSSRQSVEERLNRFEIYKENQLRVESNKWKATEDLLVSMQERVVEQNRKEHNRQLSDQFLLRKKGWAVLRKLYLAAKLAAATKHIVLLFERRCRRMHIHRWKTRCHWQRTVRRKAQLCHLKRLWLKFSNGIAHLRNEKLLLHTAKGRHLKNFKERRWRLAFAYWHEKASQKRHRYILSVIHHYKIACRSLLSKLKVLVRARLIKTVTTALGATRHLRAGFNALFVAARARLAWRADRPVLDLLSHKNCMRKAIRAWMHNANIHSKRTVQRLRRFQATKCLDQVRGAFLSLVSICQGKQMERFAIQTHRQRRCTKFLTLWRQVVRQLLAIRCTRAMQIHKHEVAVNFSLYSQKVVLYRRWRQRTLSRANLQALRSRVASLLLTRVRSNARLAKEFIQSLRRGCRQRQLCKEVYAWCLESKRRLFFSKFRDHFEKRRVDFVKVQQARDTSQRKQLRRAFLKLQQRIFYTSQQRNSHVVCVQRLLAHAMQLFKRSSALQMRLKLKYCEKQVAPRSLKLSSLRQWRQYIQFRISYRRFVSEIRSRIIRIRAKRALRSVLPRFVKWSVAHYASHQKAKAQFRKQAIRRGLALWKEVVRVAVANGRTKKERQQRALKASKVRSRQLLRSGMEAFRIAAARAVHLHQRTAFYEGQQHRDLKVLQAAVTKWRQVVLIRRRRLHTILHNNAKSSLADPVSKYFKSKRSPRSDSKTLKSARGGKTHRMPQEHQSALIQAAAAARKHQQLATAFHRFRLTLNVQRQLIIENNRLALHQLKAHCWHIFVGKLNEETERRQWWKGLNRRAGEHSLGQLEAQASKFIELLRQRRRRGRLLRRASRTGLENTFSTVLGRLQTLVSQKSSRKRRLAMKLSRRRTLHRGLDTLIGLASTAATNYSQRKYANDYHRRLQQRQQFNQWTEWITDRREHEHFWNQLAERHYDNRRKHHAILWWASICSNAHIMRSHRRIQRIPISAARARCFLVRWLHRAHDVMDSRVEKKEVDHHRHSKQKSRVFSAFLDRLLVRAHETAQVTAGVARVHRVLKQRGFDHWFDYTHRRHQRRVDRRLRTREVYLLRQAIRKQWKGLFVSKCLTARNKFRVVSQHHRWRLLGNALQQWGRGHYVQRIQHRKLAHLKGGRYWALRAVIAALSVWTNRHMFVHVHCALLMRKANTLRLRKGWNLLQRRRHALQSFREQLHAMVTTAVELHNRHLLRSTFSDWRKEVIPVMTAIQRADNLQYAAKIKYHTAMNRFIVRMHLQSRYMRSLVGMIRHSLKTSLSRWGVFSHSTMKHKRLMMKNARQQQLSHATVNGFLCWKHFTRKSGKHALLSASAIMHYGKRLVVSGFHQMQRYSKLQQRVELKFLTCLWRLKSVLFRRLLHTWVHHVENRVVDREHHEKSHEYYLRRLRERGLERLQFRCAQSRSESRGVLHYCRRKQLLVLRRWKKHAVLSLINDSSHSSTAATKTIDFRYFAQMQALKVSRKYHQIIGLTTLLSVWQRRAHQSRQAQRIALRGVFLHWSEKLRVAFTFVRKLCRLRAASNAVRLLRLGNGFRRIQAMYSKRVVCRQRLEGVVLSWEQRQEFAGFARWRRWISICISVRELFTRQMQKDLRFRLSQWGSFADQRLIRKSLITRAVAVDKKLHKTRGMRSWLIRHAAVNNTQKVLITRAIRHFSIHMRKEALYELRFRRKIRIAMQRIAVVKKRKALRLLRTGLRRGYAARENYVSAESCWLRTAFYRLWRYCIQQRNYHKAIDKAKIKASDRLDHFHGWNVRTRASLYLRSYIERMHVIHSERRLLQRCDEQREMHQLHKAFKIFLTNRSRHRKMRKSLRNIDDNAVFEHVRKCFHKLDVHCSNQWANRQQQRLVDEHCRHSCLVRGWRALIVGRKPSPVEVYSFDFH
jgi:hypothetical protein